MILKKDFSFVNVYKKFLIFFFALGEVKKYHFIIDGLLVFFFSNLFTIKELKAIKNFPRTPKVERKRQKKRETPKGNAMTSAIEYYILNRTLLLQRIQSLITYTTHTHTYFGWIVHRNTQILSLMLSHSYTLE